MTLLRYLPFFVDLAALGTSTLTYQELLQRFSTLGLRRNLLPMRFLEVTSRIVVNEQQKRDASDQRRIDATLSNAPSVVPLQESLYRYHVALRLRQVAGKTSLRSLRLALTPAAALVSITAESGHTLPQQTDLSKYLSKSPGQRAAVTGFVNFLRAEYHAVLDMPTNTQTESTYGVRRGLERMIATQLQSNLGAPDARTTLLVCALRYFHHMPIRTAKLIAATGALISISDGNVFVLHSGTKYRLPREVSAPLMAG